MPLRHTAIWKPWNLLNPNHIGRRSGVNAALRKIFDNMSDLDVLQCKDARAVKLDPTGLQPPDPHLFHRPRRKGFGNRFQPRMDTDLNTDLYPRIALIFAITVQIDIGAVEVVRSRCEAHRVAARPDPPACQSCCDLL